MALRLLIGYLAQVSRCEFVCSGDALVVAGSKSKLKAYLAEHCSPEAAAYALKKAWFEDILAGLRLGGAYAFDAEAYNRFYPMGQRMGLTVGPEDFSRPAPPGTPATAVHFVRVQCYAGLPKR